MKQQDHHGQKYQQQTLAKRINQQGKNFGQFERDN
jgi:hypothetical protein